MIRNALLHSNTHNVPREVVIDVNRVDLLTYGQAVNFRTPRGVTFPIETGLRLG